MSESGNDDATRAWAAAVAGAGVGARVRGAVRLGAFAGWTAAAFVVWAAWRPAGRAVGAAHEAARRRRILRLWARGALAAAGVRLRVEGAPPRPPYLLVANHVSYLDVPVLAAAGATGVFVAKGEVASWPVFGYLCRRFGAIFVDRSRRADVFRVNRLVEEALDRGEGVVVFAEGTSTDGADVSPLKPALLEAAARRGLGVRAARVAYATPADAPAARLAVAWWGAMPFFPHLAALFRLPRVEAAVAFAPVPVAASDRKALAGRLREVLRALRPPLPRPAAGYPPVMETGRPSRRRATR